MYNCSRETASGFFNGNSTGIQFNFFEKSGYDYLVSLKWRENETKMTGFGDIWENRPSFFDAHRGAARSSRVKNGLTGIFSYRCAVGNDLPL